jgi:predicted NAD/FAD-binding protein
VRDNLFDRRRIAIVGSGIAGMVAARELNKHHDVTVFEANDYIGGHTHTVTVEDPTGPYGIDTGFIVFNDRNYPLFTRLLSHLGVPSEPTDMSFGVHCEQTGLEYNGSSLAGLFCQRRNLLRPSFYVMLRDILKFNGNARVLLESDNDQTLGEYVAERGFGATFRDKYLVPMAASIWSAKPKDILDFPAKAMIRFFDNHGLLNLRDRPQWRVVSGGSKNYITKLVEPYRDRIRLNTPVTRVHRHADRVVVELNDSQQHDFDAVFFACHSDQVLEVLDDASQQEQEILGSIPYQPNEAILHTDTSLLPRSKNALAAWNYRVPPTTSPDPVVLTYSMNTLQNITPKHHYCVSLNSNERIREDLVIKRINYHHPIFRHEALTAQQRLPEINGVQGTYYCGAYWGYGFHEDGVRSAVNAVDIFEKNELEQQRDLRRAG